MLVFRGYALHDYRSTRGSTSITCLSPVLVDDEGVVALLRDDFMGGAQEVTSAGDSFLYNIITSMTLCVEQFGG